MRRTWPTRCADVVRTARRFSLSLDHRVCDGGVTSGFLRYVADCVERPVAPLAELPAEAGPRGALAFALAKCRRLPDAQLSWAASGERLRLTQHRGDVLCRRCYELQAEAAAISRLGQCRVDALEVEVPGVGAAAIWQVGELDVPDLGRVPRDLRLDADLGPGPSSRMPTFSSPASRRPSITSAACAMSGIRYAGLSAVSSGSSNTVTPWVTGVPRRVAQVLPRGVALLLEADCGDPVAVGQVEQSAPGRRGRARGPPDARPAPVPPLLFSCSRKGDAWPLGPAWLSDP